MRGGKEVAIYRESHFEGLKEGEKERTKTGVNFLKEESSGKRQFIRVTRSLRLV